MFYILAYCDFKKSLNTVFFPMEMAHFVNENNRVFSTERDQKVLPYRLFPVIAGDARHLLHAKTTPSNLGDCGA